MRRIFCILVFLIFISPVYAGPIYKWTDENGVVHFSDDLSKVPPAYRDRVGTEKWEDMQKPEAPSSASPQAPLQKGEEVKKDTYGQDETYWKQRARPWKERLEEASANYARTQAKYEQTSADLTARRYGSPTQYKTGIIELDRLKEEMEKYQADISEANEMLSKISKEAEEANANPDWLK